MPRAHAVAAAQVEEHEEGKQACPYCDCGKVKGLESDGKKEREVHSDCEKCTGSGKLRCVDANGQCIALGETVTMRFTVTNFHTHHDGKVHVELTAEGERTHFAVVDSSKVHKA